MKRVLKKRIALGLLSAAMTVPSVFPAGAVPLTEGSWKQEDGVWRFYRNDNTSYAGWIRTASGWYYARQEDHGLVTGWQVINGKRYYFNQAGEGIEGLMRMGWYQDRSGAWYFFDNRDGSGTEGQLVTGWQWIDGRCYYFDQADGAEAGKMYANTMTPDGYRVNADGQWVDGNGITQIRSGTGFSTAAVSVSTGGSSGGSSGGSTGGSGGGGTVKPPTTDPNKPGGETQVEYQYLLMNIPYEDFYKAELSGNNEAVDAISSPTKNKTRTPGLVGGSYHVNADGSDISGITFPVRVRKDASLSAFKQITDSDKVSITVTNRGQTTTQDYVGKDALFENADYAYYALNETPDFYKELTINADGSLSFGKISGTVQTMSGVTAELLTSTGFGDYQLNLSGLPDAVVDSTAQMYGIVLHTKEGEDYAMRHLENIWRKTELAWSTGFVTASNHGGLPLHADHYRSMMGQTITGLTCYTSAGIFEASLGDIYVPKKFEQNISVAETDVADERAAVSGLDKLPQDFDALYTITNGKGEEAAGFTFENGAIVWTGTPAAGNYTLNLHDKNGKYADITVSFTLFTEAVPAAFKEENGVWKLVAADDVSQADFLAYLGSIQSVKVNGKSYAASGRRSVKIIDTTTGEINFEAKENDAAIFTQGESYELEITATGYRNNVKGTIVAGVNQKPEEAKEGEATVTSQEGKPVSGSYQAKVLVTTDADGKITSVKDNGTEPGGNSTFWDTATGMFNRLIGKTADEVDDVDAVTGATVSSEAIKEAVKNALSKETPPAEKAEYVLMNIPYEEFYAGELSGNDEAVDQVSSATKTKTRAPSLVGGSYHINADGSDISGVIYPVKVNGADLSGFKQVKDSDSLSYEISLRGNAQKIDLNGKETLFQNPDHAYYVLSETPSFYKELTVNSDGTLSFSATRGNEETASGVTAKLSTNSGFGDYQLDVSGLPEAVTADDAQIYGVVIHTKEDVDYGLRHLENIWRKTELAWSAGFMTQSSHGGSVLKPEHYASMMGKTINGLTYYTSAGIFEIALDDIYVPEKFKAEITVAEADVSDAGAAITGLDKLPQDYDAAYSVTDQAGEEVSGFAVENGSLTWTGTPAAGVYTLTIHDNSGKYADITVSFTISTEAKPAAFKEENGVWKLAAADDVSQEDFLAYLGSIQSVKVNGKEYKASGRGSVKIIDSTTGEIDYEAKDNDAAIFTQGESYELEITATGYKNNVKGTIVAGKNEKPEGTETVETSATVETFGYEAKLKVTYDKATGKVISVSDNGTDAGSSASFWEIAISKMLPKFAGKTRSEVDGLDAKTGATLSSNAMKEAVKKALPEEQKPEGTNMQTLNFTVDGETHTIYYEKGAGGYYDQKPTFTVGGVDVTAQVQELKQNYRTVAYYYIPDGEQPEGTLYGVADVPYAEFYLGEKMTVSKPWTSDISLSADMRATVLKTGGYDAVSSATTGKYGSFGGAYYGEKTDSGYKIEGVETPVAIDADVYVKASVLAAVGATANGQQNNLLAMVQSMTASDGAETRSLSKEEPVAYKWLYSNGLLSEMQNSDDAAALTGDPVVSISTESRYGNYQINVEGLPEEIQGRENVLGVMLSTSNGMGDQYGLEHLENIWFNAAELAVAVKDGVESHGNKISFDRYSTLEGETIESITYLLSDHKMYTIDGLDLYLPKLLKDDQGAEVTDVDTYVADTDMTVRLKLNLPDDYEAEAKEVRFGNTVLDEEAYSFDRDYQELIFNFGTKPGSYTLVLKDAGPEAVTARSAEKENNSYADVSVTFTIESGMSADNISLKDNQVSLNFKNLTVDDYRRALTSAVVDGKNVRVSGTELLNEDGSINFDATVTSHGSTSKVFAKGAQGSYTLKLEAAGYPALEAQVGGEAQPETGLADGVWYGTGTDSIYYDSLGPDIVKITIKNGVISDAVSVKAVEDEGFERGGDYVLKNVVGLSDLTEFSGTINKQNDAISGATRGAEGHLSAVENALERSKKYAEDGEEQSIAYMDFAERPKSAQSSGTLDLSDTVLEVHMTDGSVKEVPFADFDQYGITTDPEQGSALGTAGTTLQVMFEQADSMIGIPSNVQSVAAAVKRVPTKLVATLEDGTETEIPIVKGQYDYTIDLETDDVIKSLALYADDEKVAEGKYHAAGFYWDIDLRKISAGEGYTGWDQNTYQLTEVRKNAEEVIKKLVIAKKPKKLEYKVGEKIDLSGIWITTILENGGYGDYDGWEACEKAGFTIEPGLDYVFTDADTKNMKDFFISIESGGKTVTIDFYVKVTKAEEADSEIADEVISDGTASAGDPETAKPEKDEAGMNAADKETAGDQEATESEKAETEENAADQETADAEKNEAEEENVPEETPVAPEKDDTEETVPDAEPAAPEKEEIEEEIVPDQEDAEAETLEEAEGSVSDDSAEEASEVSEEEAE